MTFAQFDEMRYGYGDYVRYRDNEVYKVVSVDFEERLFGILMEIEGGEPDDISWVRCENCDYIPNK